MVKKGKNSKKQQLKYIQPLQSELLSELFSHWFLLIVLLLLKALFLFTEVDIKL